MAIATFDRDPAQHGGASEPRFKLLEELCRAGDAVFWRAHDRRGSKSCVVRVFDSVRAETSRLGDLHRERTLAERLAHAAVLRTDVPLIEGERIHQIVDPEPVQRFFDPSAAGGRLALLTALGAVARVFADVHARGAFHGSFGLESCLRTADGRLILQGFAGDAPTPAAVRDGIAADHQAFLSLAEQVLATSGGPPPRLERYFLRHLAPGAPRVTAEAMANLADEFRESLEDTFPWPQATPASAPSGPTPPPAPRAAAVVPDTRVAPRPRVEAHETEAIEEATGAGAAVEGPMSPKPGSAPVASVTPTTPALPAASAVALAESGTATRVPAAAAIAAAVPDAAEGSRRRSRRPWIAALLAIGAAITFWQFGLKTGAAPSRGRDAPRSFTPSMPSSSAERPASDAPAVPADIAVVPAAGSNAPVADGRKAGSAGRDTAATAKAAATERTSGNTGRGDSAGADAGLVTEARPALEQRQVAERVRELLRLAGARLRSGALTEPASDNARFYLESARALAPRESGIARLSEQLVNRAMNEARSATARGDAAAANRWIRSAGDLGVPDAELEPLRAQLAAAQTTTRAAEVGRLSELVAQRIGQGRLVEPAGDSAKGYFNALLAADPNGPTVASMRQPLGRAMLGEARDAISRGDFASTQRWLSEAEGVGAPASDVAPVNADLLAERERLQQRDQVVGAGSLKRVRVVEPSYPREAKAQNVTGWVDLEFTVTPSGAVDDIKVNGSQPATVFDVAAVKAISKWRFEPVRRDGQAVGQRARLRMRFEME